jgi:chemotaxis protein MotB
MNDERKSSSTAPWVLWAITLVAAVGAGWWAWQRLEVANENQREAVEAVSAASQRVTECETNAKGLEEKVSALTLERDELASKASQLTVTLVQREEELARLTAASKSLEDKLSAEIKRGDVKVTQKDGRIQVDLIDKVLFDSAQAEVSARGEEVLQRLGGILQTMEDRQIQISGHTDDSPITLPDLKAKFPSNWELSTARAVNVVRILSEKSQVKPGRLIAAGYGQFRPVASNATPKGRAANRRIEVLLIPEIDARKTTLSAKEGVAK